jgi:hypothetical protein
MGGHGVVAGHHEGRDDKNSDGGNVAGNSTPDGTSLARYLGPFVA